MAEFVVTVCLLAPESANTINSELINRGFDVCPLKSKGKPAILVTNSDEHIGSIYGILVCRHDCNTTATVFNEIKDIDIKHFGIVVFKAQDGAYSMYREHGNIERTKEDEHELGE